MAAPLSAQSASQEAQIRAPVWVYAEPVPGSQNSVNSQPGATDEPADSTGSTTANSTTSGSTGAAPGSTTAPVKDLTELSRFVLAGMIYGWKYEYRPSDRLRGVAEEFSLTPIGTIDADDPSFSLTGLTADYPRITCWAQYQPNAVTARWQRHWEGITVKTGYGIGRGERTEEAAGIRAAYEAALLNAVRERARKLEKNKPKEIRGEVLLRQNPRLYADAGQFVADIRVVLSIDELIPWSSF